MSARSFLSRRAVLSGTPASPRGDGQAHLCSLVVHSRPEALARVLEDLHMIPGVETHGHNAAGKIVVTVETSNDDDVVRIMGHISELAGVLSTALVFQHAEPSGAA